MGGGKKVVEKEGLVWRDGPILERRLGACRT